MSREVWVTVHSTTGSGRTIHTRPDCPNIGDNNESKPLSVFPESHRHWCGICEDGEINHDVYSNVQPERKLASRLFHADPDDVGGESP